MPNYPDPGRYWDVCEKYAVNSFYTAPTAIRALKRFGDEFVTKHDLSSLRVLGTAGEPIQRTCRVACAPHREVVVVSLRPDCSNHQRLFPAGGRRMLSNGQHYYLVLKYRCAPPS